MPDSRQRPQSSLRRVLWTAVAPLCLLLVSSFGMVLWMVDEVHDNIEGIYVEVRKIAQARILADEVKGIESWVLRAPSLAPTERDIADADARQHLDAAQEILLRFDALDMLPAANGTAPASSPGQGADQGERGLAAVVRTELDLLEKLLANPTSGLEQADPHVRAASRAALALASEIEAEARRLGAGLVQTSEEFVRVVLLVTIIAAAVLGLAVWMFQERILRPLDKLRLAVRQIDSGSLDLDLSLRHQDELGILAKTLQAMTQRLRAHQEDLQARVEKRTTELLRTARLADLGTLAAGVAHEINNPLAAIATCAEGLLRDSQRATMDPGGSVPDPKRAQEYLQIIAKEAMRARDTTSRLLAFARPESGRREPVWLSRELEEVTTMLEHSAMRSGIRFDVRIDKNLKPVLGDPADLRQVVFNLLKNALDASPSGAHISVQASNLGDGIQVAVEDQGGGVPPALLERIFEPFVTTKEPGKGTGLGLAISHRIIAELGGSLRAQNQPHGGARFTLELPSMPQS